MDLATGRKQNVVLVNDPTQRTPARSLRLAASSNGTIDRSVGLSINTRAHQINLARTHVGTVRDDRPLACRIELVTIPRLATRRRPCAAPTLACMRRGRLLRHGGGMHACPEPPHRPDRSELLIGIGIRPSQTAVRRVGCRKEEYKQTCMAAGRQAAG
jgi:hypothetical protein